MTDAFTVAKLTPPNMFMCTLCFDIFDVRDAWVDDEGDPWNICVPCHYKEVSHFYDV